MKFPVLHGKQTRFPSGINPKCPICNSKQVWGHNEYVELSGGNCSKIDLSFENDFWLDWFSANNSEGVQLHAELCVVSEVVNSKFQLAFCSTKCLRKFFNIAVDKLEHKICKHKKP